MGSIGSRHTVSSTVGGESDQRQVAIWDGVLQFKPMAVGTVPHYDDAIYMTVLALQKTIHISLAAQSPISSAWHKLVCKSRSPVMGARQPSQQKFLGKESFAKSHEE